MANQHWRNGDFQSEPAHSLADGVIVGGEPDLQNPGRFKSSWSVPGAMLESLSTRVRKITRIAGDRYAMEMAADARPEQLLAEITAAGGALVSLNPLRETLEDFFVRRVAQVGEGARGATT